MTRKHTVTDAAGRSHVVPPHAPAVPTGATNTSEATAASLANAQRALGDAARQQEFARAKKGNAR